MKHIIEAGTDAASLVLYDPAILPPGFDTATHDDPAGFLARLHDEGRVYWMDTGADGGYLLHAYVDEPVPSALTPYVKDPIVVETFQVPSGRLYFVGSEFAGHDVDASLTRYPHMGGPFDVRPGVYRLTMCRAEYPNGLQEGQLRRDVSPGAYTIFRGMGCLVWLAILCLIGIAVALFGEIFRPWRVYLLPALAFGIALPFVVARLRPYREARARFREIEREHPSVVAQMDWKGTA